MWTFFAVVMTIVVTAIILLIRRFSCSSVSTSVRIATAYAWLTSMWVVALVPLDVYSTLIERPEGAVSVMWDISYWSTQALTWLLLPFFQVYADAGDFTVWARCLTSLKENAILYAAAGVAGVIGIVLLLSFGHMSIPSLMAIGIGLSNTFGLLAGLLLLGYGLISLPRLFWKSKPEQLSKWCAHRAGRFADSVVKTSKELETVVNIIVANKRQMARHDPLRSYMDIIIDYAEQESPVKPSSIGQVNFESLPGQELDFVDDLNSLASLRRRLFHAISDYKAAHTQYEEAILQAFELEAIIKARSNGDLAPPELSTSPFIASCQKAAWAYKVLVRPYSSKALAVLLALTSIVVIWCEVTIVTGVHPDLSPLSHAIRSTSPDAASTQILVLLPLAYICACTYFALFSINAFKYNRLLPRATTGVALMQNGSLMCRFAAATCWNFLHMIHMAGGGSAGDERDTVFSEKMGTMTFLPILNRHLNVYAPAILVVHCALVASGTWERIASMCVPAKFKFTDDDRNDMYTEKGRELIRREQDAKVRGFKVGEVLHASFGEMGDEEGKSQKGKKGGLFSSWFGGGGSSANGGSSSRFGASGGAEGNSEPSPARSSLMSALVSNRHGTPSSSSSTSTLSAPEPKVAGLDGIFADLRHTRPASKPTARSGDEEDGDSTTPMLGRWGRR